MPDAAFVNRCLAELEGFVYRAPEPGPGPGAAPGSLHANDSLLVLVWLHEDYLRLSAPVISCDELESEDFRTDVTDDTEFFQEEAARFNYFLEASRCAGASRGLSVSLHEDVNAVCLNSKALYAVLTPPVLHGLVRSLLRVVVTMRMQVFPDEVDPELARLCRDEAAPGDAAGGGQETGMQPGMQV